MSKQCVNELIFHLSENNGYDVPTKIRGFEFSSFGIVEYSAWNSCIVYIVVYALIYSWLRSLYYLRIYYIYIIPKLYSHCFHYALMKRAIHPSVIAVPFILFLLSVRDTKGKERRYTKHRWNFPGCFAFGNRGAPRNRKIRFLYYQSPGGRREKASYRFVAVSLLARK